MVFGTGMNGAVVMAKHRDSGRVCAVKTFSTLGLDAARYRRLYNEVDIFLRMDHPNVCKLLEVYEDDAHVYLVMEACTGKDLYDRLAVQKRFTEEEAAVTAKQMLEAVHYCHTHGVCHRDLKLENWVYSEPRSDAPLRLIDFGISQIVSTSKEKMSDTHGTVYYVAPEILMGDYDFRCDVWSIGVIVYMLLSGSPPFTGEDARETVRNIFQASLCFDGPRWEGVSPLAKEFISSLLQKNPSDRPSALEASKSEWIRTFVTIQEPKSDLIDSGLLEILCQFAKESDVKRAALSLVAFSINPKVVCDALADEFRSLDFDESGTIRLGDLTKALTERLGLDAVEAEKIFRKLDQTGDEEIHYSEFLAACLHIPFVMRVFALNDADTSTIEPRLDTGPSPRSMTILT
ncbi:calcium-dependent protein kinase, putative [Perkinsus marinus ATCC 50983]|uniref:Calcium-dependent protein kinase, putative n=1 Tax=Perkinsus marinus (strain ATCC 50983 / TXsc) TaxID=423536 RepID=C5LQP9_PERM5|nr:calcium-dependent protein kinase, putative [Perkinsus marinus ATCC 50983]EER00784.1 calcium-dependent protein kinase, putative [Perkinsus marinus ATCC 50983]|eukprot:XP_002768066.1 calcium-dependent protein kinase, putative [Perkinsus marinus ATCC 50983]